MIHLSSSVQGQLADEAVGCPEPAAVVVPGAGRRVQVQVSVHTADTALAPPGAADIIPRILDIIYNYVHTIRPEVVGLAGCPGGKVHLGAVGPEPAALLLVGRRVVPVAAQPEHAATGAVVSLSNYYLLDTIDTTFPGCCSG